MGTVCLLEIDIKLKERYFETELFQKYCIKNHFKKSNMAF